MKIILSRKGFDSSYGKNPSPIFPDGRMLSLPIPSQDAPIQYQDIRWQEYNLGELVETLTNRCIPATYNAHLDPDIQPDSLPRHPNWRPMFGQVAAAQGHLHNQGIQAGDIFLFFGLFQRVEQHEGKLRYIPQELRQHVIWGWLQIATILNVDTCDRSAYPWAQYHHHFQMGENKRNRVYVAEERLTLPNGATTHLPGAGVFPTYDQQLRLTAPDSPRVTQWDLPAWCYPRGDTVPFTYHPNHEQWQKTEAGVRLHAASRGQEFVLDAEVYPEAVGWLGRMLNLVAT
jgi:hypothetical protein